MTIEEFEAKMSQPRFDDLSVKSQSAEVLDHNTEPIEVRARQTSFWSKLKSKLTKA